MPINLFALDHLMEEQGFFGLKQTYEERLEVANLKYEKIYEKFVPRGLFRKPKQTLEQFKKGVSNTDGVFTSQNHYSTPNNRRFGPEYNKSTGITNFIKVNTSEFYLPVDDKTEVDHVFIETPSQVISLDTELSEKIAWLNVIKNITYENNGDLSIESLISISGHCRDDKWPVFRYKTNELDDVMNGVEKVRNMTKEIDLKTNEKVDWLKAT